MSEKTVLICDRCKGEGIENHVRLSVRQDTIMGEMPGGDLDLCPNCWADFQEFMEENHD